MGLRLRLLDGAYTVARLDALARIPDSQQKPLRMPYIELRSLSNGNLMRVYVEHGPVQPHPQPGVFNAYGLSATATVPWF